jgi:hypothetical protein
MSNYDDRNSGATFKNDRKQTEKHPDYTGNGNLTIQRDYLEELLDVTMGDDIRLDFYKSTWLKTSQKGTKFMSDAYTIKQVELSKKPEAPNFAEDLDDDLPF